MYVQAQRRIAVFILAALTTIPMGRSEAQTHKPNIVVIMGDDIGWSNIGAYNRSMMAGRTPNLDKLAAEGMLFQSTTPRRVAPRDARTSPPASYPFAPASPPWARRERRHFVLVQQVVGQYAQSFIQFPPMQKGASFNLEAVKEEIGKAIRSHQDSEAHRGCLLTLTVAQVSSL
jgi:hypothetical protein